MKAKVLVVDDDRNYLLSMKDLLVIRGYQCVISQSGLDLDEILDRETIDIILLDLKMPGKDGLQIMTEIFERRNDIPVIMISGQGEIYHAVEAIKRGAFDFIEKGESVERIFTVMENALKKRDFLRSRKKEIQKISETIPFLGESLQTKHIIEVIQKIASTDLNVLIMGESGTGKELVARQIHEHSSRRNNKFLAINCANLNPNLIESELFGHSKGAFTGADSARVGKVVESNGGTLFMDEIGELSEILQGKLLRVLETGEVTPLGQNQSVRSNFRLVSATNRDLHRMVHEKKFRDDLFYRIAQYVINIPPLRQRPDDIIPIFRYYLQLFSRKYGFPIPELHPSVEEMLMSYLWPGNVRELRNFAENITVFLDGRDLTPESVCEIARGPLQHHPISQYILSLIQDEK